MVKEEQSKIIETMYRDHFHAVEVHAYRFLGNWDETQVAAQETFCIALEKMDEFLASPNRIGWLKNTVKYVSSNMRRDRQRAMQTFVSMGDLTEADVPYTVDAAPENPMERFDGVISREEHMLLQWILLEGVTRAEAAKRLNISAWACHKRFQRALEKIRRAKSGES